MMRRTACTALLAVSLLSGCSVQNLIENRAYIADSLQRPATVATARGTFLLRSSRMFYPGDLPRDPQELPSLGAEQRQGAEDQRDQRGEDEGEMAKFGNHA